jgi:hypothetical protein
VGAGMAEPVRVVVAVQPDPRARPLRGGHPGVTAVAGPGDAKFGGDCLLRHPVARAAPRATGLPGGPTEWSAADHVQVYVHDLLDGVAPGVEDEAVAGFCDATNLRHVARELEERSGDLRLVDGEIDGGRNMVFGG